MFLQNILHAWILLSSVHTCPIYEDNEIHDNFVRHHKVSLLSLRTTTTVVWLGFGGG